MTQGAYLGPWESAPMTPHQTGPPTAPSVQEPPRQNGRMVKGSDDAKERMAKVRAGLLKKEISKRTNIEK